MEYFLIFAAIAVVVYLIIKGKKSSGSGAASSAQASTPSGGPTVGSVSTFTPGNPARNGDSWGPDMPAESNQYNYPGPWQAYFADVLGAEFTQYDIVPRQLPEIDSTAFEFRRFGSTSPVLVVCVLSEEYSEAKVSKAFERAGVPFDLHRNAIRFYHNHKGWWNTRSYVVRRVNEALARNN